MGEVIIGYIGTFSESFNVAVLVWPLLSLLLSVPVLWRCTGATDGCR